MWEVSQIEVIQGCPCWTAILNNFAPSSQTGQIKKL